MLHVRAVFAERGEVNFQFLKVSLLISQREEVNFLVSKSFTFNFPKGGGQLFIFEMFHFLFLKGWRVKVNFFSFTFNSSKPLKGLREGAVGRRHQSGLNESLASLGFIWSEG